MCYRCWSCESSRTISTWLHACTQWHSAMFGPTKLAVLVWLFGCKLASLRGCSFYNLFHKCFGNQNQNLKICLSIWNNVCYRMSTRLTQRNLMYNIFFISLPRIRGFHTNSSDGKILPTDVPISLSECILSLLICRMQLHLSKVVGCSSPRSSSRVYSSEQVFRHRDAPFLFISRA